MLRQGARRGASSAQRLVHNDFRSPLIDRNHKRELSGEFYLPNYSGHNEIPKSGYRTQPVFAADYRYCISIPQTAGLWIRFRRLRFQEQPCIT